MLDAICQLGRGKAAEDDGMDRSDARARKHRHDRFRNHRHVDDHAVAVLDSLLEQRTRKSRNLVAQLAISEGLRRASDGGVVDERNLVGTPALDVSIKSVVAGVQAAAAEPAIHRCLRVVEHQLPGFHPIDCRSSLGPELFPLLEGAPIDVVKSGHSSPPVRDRTPRIGAGQRSRTGWLDDGLTECTHAWVIDI